MFSKEEIQELQELFRTELRLEISDEEACRYAAQLVNLLRVTYMDMPDNSSPP